MNKLENEWIFKKSLKLHKRKLLFLYAQWCLSLTVLYTSQARGSKFGKMFIPKFLYWLQWSGGISLARFPPESLLVLCLFMLLNNLWQEVRFSLKRTAGIRNPFQYNTFKELTITSVLELENSCWKCLMWGITENTDIR